MSADLEQGTEAWRLARVGKFGASRLGDLLAKGEGKTRAKLILQLACERLSGVPQGWEGNDATAEGTRQEELARRAYEKRHNLFVEQVGFVPHPVIPNTGASPDGLVNTDGGLEIKSHVKFITHLEAIQAGMAKRHLYQIQWGMACTGRTWWDYGHHCSEAPEHLRLFLFPRVFRDETIIATLAVAIREADAEVEAIVAKFRRAA